MKSAWQLAATQTFNLGWDQMILLEGVNGASRLVYRDAALNVQSAKTPADLITGPHLSISD
jgi:hypothetical protein